VTKDSWPTYICNDSQLRLHAAQDAKVFIRFRSRTADGRLATTAKTLLAAFENGRIVDSYGHLFQVPNDLRDVEVRS
jgi:hypothetical protein